MLDILMLVASDGVSMADLVKLDGLYSHETIFVPRQDLRVTYSPVSPESYYVKTKFRGKWAPTHLNTSLHLYHVPRVELPEEERREILISYIRHTVSVLSSTSSKRYLDVERFFPSVDTILTDSFFRMR